MVIEIGLDADALLGAQFPVTVTGSDDRVEVDAIMVRDVPPFREHTSRRGHDIHR
jgi:hypothetical protein